MKSKPNLTKEGVVLLLGVLLTLIAFSQLIVVHSGNLKVNGATTNIAKKTGTELLFDPPLRSTGGFSSYFSHETKKLYVCHFEGYREETTHYLYDIDFKNGKITLIKDINISNLVPGLNTSIELLYSSNNCLTFFQGRGMPLLEYLLDEQMFQNSTIICPLNLHSDLPSESDSDWRLLGIWQNKLIFAESINLLGNFYYSDYKHFIGEYSIETLELIKKTEVDFDIYNSGFLQNGIIWFEDHDVQHISYNQLTDEILSGYSVNDFQISQVVRDFLPLGSGSIQNPIMGKGRQLLGSYSVQEKSIIALYRFIGDYSNEEYGPTEPYNPNMIQYLYKIQFYNFTEYSQSDFVRDLLLPIFGVIGGSGLIIFVILSKFFLTNSYKKVLYYQNPSLDSGITNNQFIDDLKRE